jgi:hypothetical protein
MVWLLETFILEEINLISKSESANTGRRNKGALLSALLKGTDPKFQIILLRNPKIIARIGRFLWLSEDLVFFYFDK